MSKETKTKKNIAKSIAIITIIATIVVIGLILLNKKSNLELRAITPKEFNRYAVDLSLAVKEENKSKLDFNTESLSDYYKATSDISSIEIELMIFNDEEGSNKYYENSKNNRDKVKEIKGKNCKKLNYKSENIEGEIYTVNNTIISIKQNINDKKAEEKKEQFKNKIVEK